MKLLTCLLVAAPAVAIAEPARYVDVQTLVTSAASDAVGYSSDGTTDSYLGFALEGGLRLAAVPWLWAHGELSYLGHHTNFNNSAGDIGQVRAGVEARTCTAREGACGVATIDLGIERGRSSGGDTMSTAGTALVAIPRLAFDFGGRVRGRVGIELTEALYGSGTQSSPTELSWWGVALIGGVGYQW